MTNEEKARKISSKYIYDNEVMHYEHGDVIYEYETFGEETKDAALEMAEWKDAQFKEYLEKKREELFNSNCLSVEPYIDFINEIINELFGVIEQDNSDREE